MKIHEIEPYVRYISILEYPTGHSPHWMYATDKMYRAYDARLLYCLGGSGEVEVNGQRFPMQKGALLVWRSMLPYRYLHSEKKDMVVLRTNFDFTYQQAARAILPVPPDPAGSFREEDVLDHTDFFETLYTMETRALESVLFQLLHTFEGPGKYRAEECSALLKYVLTKVIASCEAESAAPQSPTARLAALVCAYLDEHACELSTVHQVGEIFSYHPYYLNRIMLREKGKNLHEYFMQAKIQKAMKLLASQDLSIAQVAEQCGFYDSSHFSKHFRAATGYRPSQYRHL